MPDNLFSMLSSIMLQAYRLPSITAYNRLEPNPRDANFDRSLKAEIRDPLWMLSRQWSFGEFQGEDAASPVTAQILGEHTAMDKVGFPSGTVFRYDENIPLETKIEGERLKHNLFLAVQMGRYFIKLMRHTSIESHLDKFLMRFPLNFTIDTNDYEGQQLFHAINGKIFDGYNVFRDIVSITESEADSKYDKWITAYDDADIGAADKVKLIKLADTFKEWFLRNYSQPDDDTDTAWRSTQLEYQFSLSSAEGEGQRVLVADQYSNGRIDWFSFDLDSSKGPALDPEPRAGVSAVENLVSFIPSPISFNGIPDARYWSMEENQVDFGVIDTTTTGLLHLLFAEFGLIFSNDWFVLPYPLSINTLCEIKGIVVTDVFGQHILIKSAGRGLENDWQRWALFHHTDKNGANSATNTFYLPPALIKVLEEDPLERVYFLRDEVANMVWAVEETVPSQAGKGVSGKEMALRRDLPVPVVPPSEAEIRYGLGTVVPDNWIPFIPVQIDGNNREIQLQRARFPASKGAKGQLLTEKETPYFINEEEVPRAGLIVRRSFQRARGLNGKTYLWVGRQKEAGKGEGWSNLKFDQIETTRQE